MSKIVGGLACMAALTAGIFNDVDPTLCLSRAGVALMGGCVLGALWQALLVAPDGARVAVREGADATTSVDG